MLITRLAPTPVEDDEVLPTLSKSCSSPKVDTCGPMLTQLVNPVIATSKTTDQDQGVLAPPFFPRENKQGHLKLAVIRVYCAPHC